jgi:hypothetical protein
MSLFDLYATFGESMTEKLLASLAFGLQHSFRSSGVQGM